MNRALLWSMLRRVDWIRFVILNFCCKQVRRAPGAYILPYRGARLEIARGASIELNAHLIVNWFDTKHPGGTSYVVLENGAHLVVERQHTLYYGADIKVFSEGTLILGSGYCHSRAQIRCHKSITIGDGAAIARDVIIIDSDAHPLSYPGYVMSKDVRLEGNVWVGSRAMILKGVTVGAGAIIAAGAVVTKDVPSHSVVAGIPAKVIRENVAFNK